MITMSKVKELSNFELYASKLCPVFGTISIISFVYYGSMISFFALIVSFITFFSYFAVRNLILNILTKYPEEKQKFVNTNTKRQMYIVKNLIKSTYLFILSFLTVKIFYDTLNNNIDINFIKICAIIYTINDMFGLILSDLPLTTIFHHSMTSLMCHVVLLKNDSELDYRILIVIYATFSSLSYIVNFYLGSRLIPPVKTWKYKSRLSYISFLVYVITSFINWFVQFYMIITLISVPYLYFVFLFVVIRDDIILMQWLYKDSFSS